MVGLSMGRCPRGASMGHGVMARQGVGPGNRQREWDDIEAEAHRRSDGAAAQRRNDGSSYTGVGC
jgi:hypothetical protein